MPALSHASAFEYDVLTAALRKMMADCKTGLAAADDNRLDQLAHGNYPDQRGREIMP
jgi:hypothetical protein